jgi:hypothetical protein
MNYGHYYFFGRENANTNIWHLLEDENVYKREINTANDLKKWIKDFN